MKKSYLFLIFLMVIFAVNGQDTISFRSAEFQNGWNTNNHGFTLYNKVINLYGLQGFLMQQIYRSNLNFKITNYDTLNVDQMLSLNDCRLLDYKIGIEPYHFPRDLRQINLTALSSFYKCTFPRFVEIFGINVVNPAFISFNKCKLDSFLITNTIGNVFLQNDTLSYLQVYNSKISNFLINQNDFSKINLINVKIEKALSLIFSLEIIR